MQHIFTIQKGRVKYMSTATVNLTIDSDVIKPCEEIYARLGLSLSNAVNMFLHQSLIHHGLPFHANLEYNDETIAALEESEMLLKDPKTKYYTFEETIQKLKKDEENHMD